MKSSLPAAQEATNCHVPAGPVHKRAYLPATVAALAAAAALLVVSACSGNGSSASQSSAATSAHALTPAQIDETLNICSSCHGPGGRPTSPGFPVLAAQQQRYLSSQLLAFRDKTRVDPPNSIYNMAGLAAGLDNAAIASLAVYYSAQSPAAGSAQDATEVAAGQIVYQHGVPDRVLPCVVCHGVRAQGTGATPRLAGQAGLYLRTQLTYFAADPRSNEPMHQEAMSLTAPQIGGVSAYLAAQSEGAATTAIRNGPVTPGQIDNEIRVCSACHEFSGSNVSPIFNFPRLAGQQKDYLIAQLKAFRDKTRVNPPGASIDMAGMAAGLDDAMIERLAAHYAAKNPVSGSVRNSADVAAGKAIYEHGVPDEVLPCLACHGTRAQGEGIIPRLAGQRHLYLRSQLEYFATDKRANGSMHQEALPLTGQQRGEVSAYLAAQSVGRPDAAALTGAVNQEQIKALAQSCSACHEFDGKDASPAFIFPRLAGQQKDYLSAQLRAFRDKTRADPRARTYMWNAAAGLGDAMIDGLAAFYSAQTPASGSAQDAIEVAAGKTIYEQGIPDKIPPCLACHLPNAQGAGTTPRLAGQRRLSLERQLAYFAANTRANTSMHQESIALSARQIGDISAYLATQ